MSIVLTSPSQGATMHRRRSGLAAVAAGVLILALAPVAASAGPAQPAVAAVPANNTILSPGCTFNDVTAKAAENSGRITGFASFHGGTCGNAGQIWYFADLDGTGTRWFTQPTPLRGRVLDVANTGSATYMLFQKLEGANPGIWVTNRPRVGALTPGRRLSTFTGQNPHVFGSIIATGDKWRAVWSEQVGQGEFAPLFLFEGFTLGCMPGIVKRQFTFLGYDERPSLALRGTNAVDLVFERNDGAVGDVQRLLRGTVGPGCHDPWDLLSLSGPGQVRDTDPELFRTPGVNHATWVRTGRVVYASDFGAAWSVRHTSVAAGDAPELAVSGGAVFVGFTSSLNRLRLMRYRGTWQELDLTTGSNPQRLVAVVANASGGKAIGASLTSYRLFAVPNL